MLVSYTIMDENLQNSSFAQKSLNRVKIKFEDAKGGGETSGHFNPTDSFSKEASIRGSRLSHHHSNSLISSDTKRQLGESIGAESSSKTDDEEEAEAHNVKIVVSIVASFPIGNFIFIFRFKLKLINYV